MRQQLNPHSEKHTGFLRFTDGSDYEGEIENGQANGYGVLTVPNGTVYEGEFQNNYIFGEGTMEHSDGGSE